MNYKRSIAVVLVMLISFILLQISGTSENIKPNKPFNTFPDRIGPWKGEKLFFDQKVFEILGVDDSVLMNYRVKDHKLVQLYIGFYQSQKEGDLIHSPKNCMPGSGWNIVNSRVEKIRINSLGKDIKIIRLDIKKGSEHQVVYYWFQSRGRIISSEYMQKIWLVIDSVTKRRTDGSFVRILSPVRDSEEETEKVLTDFINDVYPYLTEYIPS